MNIKEFNDKKQEALNINVVADYGYIDNEALTLLMAKINELQPPTPPTCSTCKYLNSEDWYWTCDNPKNMPLDICKTDCESGISVRSCIHHSDYDEVKDESK